MQRVADFQTPSVTPNPTQEKEFADEWTPRFGILVGGWQRISWDRIGEDSIGHSAITRRVWMPFVRLQVGIRNEFDGALDMPENMIQTEWAKSDARKKWKSPRACAGDVLASFREQGYCVPLSLIGHPDPQALTEKVWPREVRDKLRLYQHVQYFENFQTDNDEEARLAGELLEAAYTARNYVQEYVRTLKDEVEGEKGLRNLNEPLKELFYELGEPLPEQKTALVAQAMGKEIVQAVKPDNSRTDAVLEALTAQTTALQEQNRLQAEQNRLLIARLDQEQVGAEAPLTKRADGEPDRRFKNNKE